MQIVDAGGWSGSVASPSDYAGRAQASERAESIEASASGSARIGLAFVDVVLAQLAVVAGRAVAGLLARPSPAGKRKCN